MDKLYRIPVWERSTRIGLFPSKIKCLCVDGIGLFVYYNNEDELDPNLIRRHLIGRKSTHCIVEAKSPEEAISIFHNEWESAKIGGEGKKENKALWINKKEEILELPYCELLRVSLRKNGGEQYVCGDEMGCVLDGYDAPDECPIDDFYDQIFKREKQGNLPVTVQGGYEFILAKDIMKQG